MTPELPDSSSRARDEHPDEMTRRIEMLERELERHQPHATPHIDIPRVNPPRPRPAMLRGIFLLLIVLIGAALVVGLLPKLSQKKTLVAEAGVAGSAKPVVPAAVVTRAPAETSLTLPGSMQPITEAPVLSRADGYVKRRYVDIGDKVKAGQLLAEIEAPELGQQVRQSEAALEQSKSGLDQARANLAQGVANRDLAKLSAARFGNLEKRGIVSRQENDVYQAQLRASDASIDALQKAVAAAQSSIAAAEANLARVKDVSSYLKVRAPFTGVVTLRNVDLGTLVSAGNTMLFRVAQVDTLRTFINVPQVNASDVKTGQPAVISLSELPGKKLAGKVVRSAGSLDPATRTMLTEIQIPNPKHDLMPGMFVNVTLHVSREEPPLLIPSEALIARGQGAQAAVVDEHGTVHYTPIQIGRDYGTDLVVLSGLQPGMKVVVNPNDKVREGAVVDTRPFERPKVGGPPAKATAEPKKAS